MFHIYYDPICDDTNLGWKVSDTENDGKVIARFTTHKAAIDYCTFIGVDYKLLVEECYEDDDDDWIITIVRSEAQRDE